MKLTYFLTIIAATSAAASPSSLYKRSCHGSGETWGADRYRALQIAQEHCDGIINGPFTTKGQYIRKCVNLSSTKKMDFWVRYDTYLTAGGPAHAIDKDDCTTFLHREINGCEHGGQTSYRRSSSSDVTVSADPNSGNCA